MNVHKADGINHGRHLYSSDYHMHIAERHGYASCLHNLSQLERRSTHLEAEQNTAPQCIVQLMLVNIEGEGERIRKIPIRH
jgi:hypothetical protein